MMKVLTIVGTRPEVIKMAPVIKALADHPEHIRPVVCCTAQHRGMLDQAFAAFGLAPDHDLDLMQPNQSLPQLTARLLTSLEAVFDAERPDWVLVQGDTTTVMATGLVAFYRRVRIAHVEAGLRTHDKWQPFPEEINRRITDLLADLYFAPTERNRAQLIAEGVAPDAVVVTGNTVIDALLATVERLRHVPLGGGLHELEGRRFALVTAHRRENFGAPLGEICAAVRALVERYPDLHVVYPVHPNPNVVGPVHDALGRMANVHLIEPVDYETLVGLLMRAHMVLTDSGGLQEEAPSLGKPVLVLRNTTERMEVVDAGAALLVGTDRDVILREASRLLDDRAHYNRMATVANPYGDGHASRRIVAALRAAS